MFHHHSKGIKTLVHGDDYLSAGTEEDLDSLELELKKKYQIKTQTVCEDYGDHSEARILNFEQMMVGGSRCTMAPGMERCESRKENNWRKLNAKVQKISCDCRKVYVSLY